MGPGFESLKAHQWPVGQAVKTAASHAANMGSIPVRVTIFFLERKSRQKELHTEVVLTRMKESFLCLLSFSKESKSVLIRARVHPFPFRTRKLSSLLPKILVWRRTGKIGSANTSFEKSKLDIPQ